MKDTGAAPAATSLLGEEKVIVIVGAAVFEESLRRQGVEVVVVRWHPPHDLPGDVAALLKELL